MQERQSQSRRLDSNGLYSVGLRIATNPIQEDCLAHTAPTDHHEAFGGTTQAEPLEADCDVGAQGAATGEFRGRAAGAGSAGIANRVHI
jgi:hypothetical protein